MVAQLGDIGPAIGAFIGTVVDRVLEAAALERRVEDRARRLAARHLHQRAHERRETRQRGQPDILRNRVDIRLLKQRYQQFPILVPDNLAGQGAGPAKQDQ